MRIGRFEIEGELGRGGMGAVYRARDPGLDRLVALKTIAPHAVARPDALARFQREARAAARLQHPNIVTVFELGEADGLQYIAMELLEGSDLAELIRSPAPPPFAEKLRLMVDVCRGLHHAHLHGVLHRDVKPANVRVTTAGVVKLVDFGIARVDDGSYTGLTQTGFVMGTPGYLPPEALRGLPLDARADMWSAAVMFYELCAGRRPFEAPDIPTLAWRIVNAPMPPLDAARLGVPLGLEALMIRALAKDPAARFADLAELAGALAALEGGRPAEPAPALAPTVIMDRAVLAATVASPAPPTPTPTRLADPSSFTPGGLRERLARMGAAAMREEALFGEAVSTIAGARSLASGELALAGNDGAIRTWDPATRMRTRVLRTTLHQRTGHDAAALCLAFSPDGALLASGHADGSVHLWDLQAASAELPARLRHDELVAALAFSPDGRTLASGGVDAVLKLWDVRAACAGDVRRAMHRQPSGVTALAYAGEAGRLLVTGHAKPVLRVSDAQSGRLVATLRGPDAPVQVLAASPDGRRLAAASRDRTLRVFDLETRAALFTAGTRSARAACDVCFFDGGALLAEVAQDDSVRLWDVASGAVIATIGTQAGASYVAVAVEESAARLVAALGDGRLRLFASV